MSETDMAVINPEMMKPYVWLQTSDDSIQQVEQEIAMFCPFICQEIIQKSMGSSKNCAICLPQQVSPAMLSLILDYCRFHQVLGRSNKERKSYDEKFVRIDTERLCELTSAADSLQLKPLVDLTSRALARIIEGRSPEEIRDIFHLPDDLTEEEKLEPLRNITDDPRIRLLNRLYAKKRKELKERERIKNVEVEEEHVDERSVDDLLSFINGNDGEFCREAPALRSPAGDIAIGRGASETGRFNSGKSDGGVAVTCRDPKGIKTSKNKKKNRRKKDQQKNSSLKEASVPDKKEEVNGHNIRHHSLEADRPCETSNSHHTDDDPMVEFDDDDTDDEIDPVLKAKIDREVEDFARRLNSDWPERIKDFLSSTQERKTMLLTTTNGNGCLRRHACMLLPCISIFYLNHHVLST
ncbi:SKP1-like protein 20 [Lathyrus oleraceus]|uniref:SKP1-like protein 20 n=1 Tax=Pisum sativum TaxID=3888 RepID=A0A9D4XIQ0_PEA|nr:SKP1-like protein 20 [Pisum sativum]